MKTSVTLFIASLLLIFFSTGCSEQQQEEQPEDIKISKLETACDYVDAIETCLNTLQEMEDKYGKDAEESQLSSADQLRVVEIQGLLLEINQDLPKKFEISDVKECPNFDKVDEMSKKYF